MFIVVDWPKSCCWSRVIAFACRRGLDIQSASVLVHFPIASLSCFLEQEHLQKKNNQFWWLFAKVCPSVEVPCVQSHRFRRLLIKRPLPNWFVWSILMENQYTRVLLLLTVRNATDSYRITTNGRKLGWHWRPCANTRPRQQSKFMSLERVNCQRSYLAIVLAYHFSWVNGHTSPEPFRGKKVSSQSQSVLTFVLDCSLLEVSIELDHSTHHGGAFILISLVVHIEHCLIKQKKSLNFKHAFFPPTRQRNKVRQTNHLGTLPHPPYTPCALHHGHWSRSKPLFMGYLYLARPHTFELRPYTTKSTASRPICEVK